MIGMLPRDDGSGCRLVGRVPVVAVPFVYNPGALLVSWDAIETRTWPRWISRPMRIERTSPIVILAHESSLFTWFGFAYPSQAGGIVMFRSTGTGLYRALELYRWPFEIDPLRYPSHRPPRELPPPPPQPVPM